MSPVTDSWIDNYNPANGAVYGQIPNSSEKDVVLAYESAQKAFTSWSNTTVEKRSEILLKIASLIEGQLEELASAESTDNGKPLSLARTVDIPRAAV